MDLQKMIQETFPLYEDMDDMEVAQTIWRRRGAEILGERLKQQLIDEACKWLFENDSYAIPTNVQVDRLREHLNNIK